MGHLPDYVCTECGLQQKRDDLVAKKVSFGTLGSSSVMLKSRTVAWLCFPCVKKDPAWQLEEYESPGFRQAEDMAAMVKAAREYKSLESGELSASTKTEPDSATPTANASDNS